MTSEQYQAPFNLELQCYSHMHELDALISMLADNKYPALQELQAISNALQHLVFKTQCATRIQAVNFRNEYQR